MMMKTVTMPERIGSDNQGQQDHTDLKTEMMYNVYAKQRQTGKKQREQGAMNGAGKGCPDT